MEIVKPYIKLEAITQLVENSDIQQGVNVEKVIEKAGRTCYKSEDKITNDSSVKFCEMIKSRNHMSVLEHASATFRIICDRGVTHEIVRHRHMAFSQESTRYCCYTEAKKGMSFITPAWANKEDLDNIAQDAYMLIPKRNILSYPTLSSIEKQMYIFIKSCMEDEWNYNALIKLGQTPQQARAVLPNCLKTEIVITANFREWLHFLDLRTSEQAHPDMRIIAKEIGNKLNEISPTIFKTRYED